MITWENYKYELTNLATNITYWDELEHSSIMVTGSTGLIGSYLVDLLCCNNILNQANCVVYPVSRSLAKLRARFPDFIGQPWFRPVIQDVSTFCGEGIQADYIINGASNAHPLLYAEDPVGTITTNVFGTYQMLRYAQSNHVRRMIQLSSVEIYGESQNETEQFNETYCGRLGCSTARDGYPESKRVSETLCHAFSQAYGTDVVIARPCRLYGPTMDMSDSKATAQFIKKALLGEDIILKSDGQQKFSYAYVADVVTALIVLLFQGKSGEAYNISDRSSAIKLKDLAELVASISGTKVVFDRPNKMECQGFSGAKSAILDSTKLEQLGWHAQTHLRDGIEKTIATLKKSVNVELTFA